MGIRINPDDLYTEQTLRVYGFDEDVLRAARRDGLLTYSELGKGMRVYVGKDLLAWIAARRMPLKGGAA